MAFVPHTAAYWARKLARDYPTKGRLNLAKSYNFVDKHSVIDELRTLMTERRMTPAMLAHESGVSESCLSSWFNGKTRSPREKTLNRVAAVFGRRVTLGLTQ